MPKITIDSTEIEVEKGTTVIQAAEQIGIDIPRYCYHPGLSIVGVCRICLVEIERMPKLQVACYTPVADGMVVHTNNEKVQQARRAVLEFLLINHPLDCPVCDQAGECWLQNFYMQHGLYDSKMVEDKVKKQKALPIGPNVMLDSERCILCTRCVRFCDEITETHELGIFNRGDHTELLPYPGQELDNKYSGNTIDICPVGALTDKDFRFRTRVWYLTETPSVCPGCSTGCNINVHHNDHRPYKAGGIRVSRLKPRYNPDVNQWWMCDEGRYGFTQVDADSRIVAPQKKTRGDWQLLSWQDAIDEIATKIKGILNKHGADAFGVILSPQMTNEGLFAAKRFFQETLEVENIDFEVVAREKGYADDFLMKTDKNPNSEGAKKIGLSAVDNSGLEVAQMLADAKDNRLKALYICHHNLEKGFKKEEVKEALSKVDLVIFQGTNQNSTSNLANYCLPSASFVEKDGTFTNFAGRVQEIHKAVEPLGESKPDWTIFRNLSKRLGKSMPYFEAGDVFNALAEEVDAFKGLSYEKIGEHGVLLNGHRASTEKEMGALVA
ncbi:MAG: 2Fe-2S iron-sulfur cluster binding domain-containing protein [Caldithrix sp.]|nr:MAG: 2Fe-2S iron-sulfur cluster binding domain-containing protein [Caldithrix sp.]